MKLLELQNLTYTYDKKRLVLNNINFGFEAGKMYAVLGPSGCGKTTLLSLLGGLDSPAGGKILFNGTDIQKSGLSKHRKKNVSFIFQNYNLIDYMTAAENVTVPRHINPKPILERLGLTSSEYNRNVLKLSGGQQQRTAIARAIAADTPVILADEPTGNLDETSAAQIIALLKECAHQMNKCIILVTHSAAAAADADTILTLKSGRL